MSMNLDNFGFKSRFYTEEDDLEITTPKLKKEVKNETVKPKEENVVS